MIVLFLLLFISLLTGCILSIRNLIKDRDINIISICSILNILFFILIFIFAK